MQKFIGLWVALFCLVLIWGGPVQAQTQTQTRQSQDRLAPTLELAQDDVGAMPRQTKRRLAIAAVVGMASGAMIFNRIFGSIPGTLAGMMVGLTLPAWLYLKQGED